MAAYRDVALSIAAVFLFFLAWQLAVSFGGVDRSLLPAPTDVYRVALHEAAAGGLHIHVAQSLFRVIAGFSIGATLGVLIGAAMGLNRPLDAMMSPLVEVMRPIPPLAWIPLAIVWFGIGDASKVFLLALTAFLPVAVNTYKGVKQIDPTIFRAALSLEMRARALAFQVAIPCALPDIMTGLRVAWGLVFAVLVAAEMIAAKSGLGFLVADGMNQGRFDVVIFGIFVIGLISAGTDYLWQLLGSRWLLRWHQGLDAARN